jgi:hypothetical protein
VRTFASFIAPLIYSNLFAYFISDKTPIQIPAIGFYLEAVLLAFALMGCSYLFYMIPTTPEEGLLVNQDVPPEEKPLIESHTVESLDDLIA